MDLITSLPKSRHYDAIFVLVDRLSKMVCLAPTRTTVSAELLATTFTHIYAGPYLFICFLQSAGSKHANGTCSPFRKQEAYNTTHL